MYSKDGTIAGPRRESPTMHRLLLAAALTVTALAVAGCDQGREDPPNVNVLAVHADPTLGTAIFRRVLANATSLEFKNSQPFSFDVDTYTFNVDITEPDGTIARTIRAEHTLEEGNTYIIVLHQAAGESKVSVFGAPADSDAGGGTKLQLLHTATSLGTVDVYVEPVGFDVLAATPLGRLRNGQILPPTLVSAGSYEIALTEADNPSNVLFRSQSIAFGGSENVFLFIPDNNGEGLAPFSISLGQGPGSDLVDVDIESGMRVLNAIADRSAIDAGIDLELAPPLIENVPFGTVTDTAVIPAGDHTVTITPAGNPGVIEDDHEFSVNRGAIGTAFVTGSPGSVSTLFVADDFRVPSGEAKLRVFLASPANASVDVFLLPPGTEPDASNVLVTATDPEATPNGRLAPGAYELTVRRAGASRVLAGPTAVTIDADSYYAILLTDRQGGGSGIEVTLLYDFN